MEPMENLIATDKVFSKTKKQTMYISWCMATFQGTHLSQTPETVQEQQ